MNANAASRDGALFRIADRVAEWRASGHRIVLARTVSMLGGSSREANEALAFAPGQPPAGALLAGALDSQLRAAAERLAERGSAAEVLTVQIDDRAAASAGLACGGTARVLVQLADDLPDRAWELLAARQPICLVTDVTGPTPGATTWFTASDRPDGAYPAPAVRLFGRGTDASAVLRADDTSAGAGDPALDRQLLVAALWPVPRLVIVGTGLIADALAAQADLLGWAPTVTADVEGARRAVTGLTGTDGVIVLSHDRAVDGPVLADALTGGAGYVGALGSRHTQNARAGWLTASGVSPSAIAAIHGPAGLDIGSRTPAEIALAITAEILAVRTAGTGGALRDRSGPIHSDHLHTPPARFPLPQLN